MTQEQGGLEKPNSVSGDVATRKPSWVGWKLSYKM
jgi:hypothetical protein